MVRPAPACLLLALAAALAVALAAPAALEPPALRFADAAQAAGIHATMRCGGPEKRWIPEANGSGAAWLDYDRDGRMDLLIVNGSTMDSLRALLAGNAPAPQPGGVYLFHNLGGGRFEDVTQRAGLVNPYWGTGANAADYDNDGYPDILITTIGRDLLYHNNRNGTFTDVSGQAGLSQNVAWHTGSTFGDYDNDGFLDLYVAAYIDIHSLSFKEPAPVCLFQNIPGFCGPIGLKPDRGILYHNNGKGAFTDVTRPAGLLNAKAAHGFTPVFEDFNADGKPDLFIANDSDPNTLLLNQGDGTFKENALERGLAFNANGNVQSNMGVALDTLDASGRLALVTTTFIDDYFPLFRQDRSGYFDEIGANAGLTVLTRNWLGWACGFADFANSGRRDLWLVNGHVYPQAPTYNQPVAILRQTGGRYQTEFLHPDPPGNSYRGGAAADFENSGRLGLIVLPIAGQPLLLRNRNGEGNHWAGFQLTGAKSNRDAIGAHIEIRYCGNAAFNTVRNGGSYLSRNDPRLHFGLGSCATLDRVTVHWPSGAVNTLENLAPDRYQMIEEPR